jgi:hypothetical protein
MQFTKAQILTDLAGTKASADSHSAGAGVLHIEAILPREMANLYTVALHSGTVSAGNEVITWSDSAVVLEISSGVSTVAQVLAHAGGQIGTPWANLSSGTVGTLTSVAQIAMSSLPNYVTGVNGYIGIGTPENPGGEGAVNGITKYIVNVNEIGASQTSRKPTGYRKNIVFYVYHEGQVDEQAWYELNEPVNQSNSDVTADGDSSFYSYTRIYNSSDLRLRTLGCLIAKAAYLLGTQTPVQSYHWAQAYIKDPSYYMDAFMTQIAANGDVRASGNQVTDSLLDYCLGVAVPVVATAYGIT